MDQKFYSNYEDRWDDILFKQQVESLIDPTYHLMDLGAGSGVNTYLNFRGKVAMIVGVDPDPSVLKNPLLDEAQIGKTEILPYQDSMFDLVIAANTLGHLDETERVFREVDRVLKPGGVLPGKTTNRYHYGSFISRLTPVSFHRSYNRIRGIDDKNTYPVKYKANTLHRLSRLAGLAGLEVISIDLFEGRPEYLRVFWPMYLFGLLFERLVNRFEQLSIFRVVIIAKFQKRR